VHAGFGLEPAVGEVASTRSVADLMPATSPPLASISSVFQPRDSHQRRYMRSRISAQSWASVPPAPAWMSTKAFDESILPENMRWNSSFLDIVGIALDVVDHRNRRAFVVFHLGELESSFRADEAVGEVADAVHDLLELRAFAAQGLRVFRLVPDIGAFQLPVHFFETFDLLVVVKDTP
jgi:hypothetical protein